jgi:hypothetical protein
VEGVFATLSPLFSGKTEATRELDWARPSTLSNADWPTRSVGAPVRWERGVYREGRGALSFCILDKRVYFSMCFS